MCGGWRPTHTTFGVHCRSARIAAARHAHATPAAHAAAARAGLRRAVNEGANLWGSLTADSPTPLLEFDFIGPDAAPAITTSPGAGAGGGGGAAAAGVEAEAAGFEAASAAGGAGAGARLKV